MSSKLRPLTSNDVTFVLAVSQSWGAPDFQSGDPAYKEADDQLEAEAKERLLNGDVWAWATVEVTAQWGSFSAVTSLGGCSYYSEDDFIKCGEQKALEDQALSLLNDQLESLYNILNSRVRSLGYFCR